MEYRYIQITVPDNNDNLLRISLENTIYWLRITWNSYGEYWKFGVYDENKKPIYTANKIIPNYPINMFIKRESLPKGMFIVLSRNKTIKRSDFVDNVARLVYIPVEEN